MSTNNKEAAIARLSTLERNIKDASTEAQKLREIIEEPQPRTPEAGDVWANRFGDAYLVTSQNDLLGITSSHVCGVHAISYISECNYTYLGKFHEVYVLREGTVQISDVWEALSIEVDGGASFIGHRTSGWNRSYNASREALAKLGIK